MGRPRTVRRLLSAWLAFWAGYADVITFVRYEAFSASMSGNVVLMGRSLLWALTGRGNGYSIFFYGAIVCCYGLGALTYHALFQRMRARAATVSGLLNGVVALVVDTLFNLYGLKPALSRWRDHTAWFICGLTPIFGAQAAVCTERCLANPTTAVAHHLDVFARTLARLPCGGPSREEGGAAVDSIVALGCFVLGALAGDASSTLHPATEWCYIVVGPSAAVGMALCDLLVGPSACEAKPASALPASHGSSDESASEKSSDREAGPY